jgi:hypothetical protein
MERAMPEVKIFEERFMGRVGPAKESRFIAVEGAVVAAQVAGVEERGRGFACVFKAEKAGASAVLLEAGFCGREGEPYDTTFRVRVLVEPVRLAEPASST